MKCPVCQAKLLPVAGDLFCLQCGDLVLGSNQVLGDDLKLEETVDPLLRRAITDSVDTRVVFSVPEAAKPVVVVGEGVRVAASVAGTVAKAEAPIELRPSFASLKRVLSPARQPVTAGLIMPVGPLVAPQDSPGTERIESAADTGARFEKALPSRGLSRVWYGLAGGLALLVGLNVAAGLFYTNRVYPGVRVGNLAVGGWTFEELHQRLATALPPPKLSAVVNGRSYELEISGVGAVSALGVEREVTQAGRSKAWPLAAVVGSWFRPPVVPSYTLSDDSVARSVERLAGLVDRTPSSAVPLVLGTNALILAEKPGTKLDPVAAAAAMRAAYGYAQTVSLTAIRLQPEITAVNYTGDVAAAQATIDAVIQITVRKIPYTPTSAQIASWVSFAGPGKGVAVDPAGPATFVASIPGGFDRSDAFSGLMTALNAHHDAALVPSTKRITGNPRVTGTPPILPLITYTYCVDATAGSSSGLIPAAAAALGTGGAWTLGGRVHYVLSSSKCNMRLQVGSPSALAALDPACTHQTSCRIHNDLAIASGSWANRPTAGTGDVTSYRLDLINHVVGQWLGFDHPGCGAGAIQASPLTAPTVTLGGCSPKWYAVPAELQDTKVLPGL